MTSPESRPQAAETSPPDGNTLARLVKQVRACIARTTAPYRSQVTQFWAWFSKKSNQDKTLEEAVFFAPVVAALFLAVSFVMLADTILFSTASIPMPKLSEPTYLDESISIARDKTMWGVSWLMLAAAMVWYAVLSIWIIFTSGRDVSFRRWSFLGSVVAAVVAAAVVWMQGNAVGGGDLDRLVGLVEDRIGSAKSLISAGNKAVLVLAALVTCATAVLANRTAPDVNLDTLKGQIHTVKLGLYSAAALLVCALFQMHSLFQLGATLYGHPEQLATFVKSMTLCGGIVFSTLLIAVYGPLLLLQRRWTDEAVALARKAVADKAAPFDEAKWSAENGLSRTAFQTAATLASIVAPFVGALATSWISVGK